MIALAFRGNGNSSSFGIKAQGKLTSLDTEYSVQLETVSLVNLDVMFPKERGFKEL